MKAKIFQSVDVANVPAEIQRLLRNLADDVAALVGKNETTVHVMNLDMRKVSNIDCVLESLHNTRLSLADLDKRLADCNDTMNGYRQYIAKKTEDEEKKHLLHEAIENQHKQKQMNRKPLAAVPVHSQDDETAGPDIDERPPITKQMIQKLAGMNNADEG
jgi:hypothetical protein